MGSFNDMLYVKAKEAIQDLYNDKSVSLEKAEENMQGLQEEIGLNLEALEADMKNEDED